MDGTATVKLNARHKVCVDASAVRNPTYADKQSANADD